MGAGLHQLPQCWSLPLGAVLQEQAAPLWVPHGVTSPASKHAPAWAPLSTGPQVLAGACSSTGLPTGSQPSPGIHLLWLGVPSTGYRWISAPPWTSMGCSGTACLTMVFHHELQGKTPCSDILSTSSLTPCLLTLVSVELFLSHCLTRLSTLPFPCRIFSFLFLNCVIPEALPLSLIAWPWPAAAPS